MTDSDKAKGIQAILEVTQDGILGPKSLAAYETLAKATQSPQGGATAQESGITGWGTIFASADDLEEYKKCKAEGMSDVEAFRYGDNCIGCWDDPTGPGTGASCALPPDDWHEFGSAARKKPVKITVVETGKTVIAQLKDTLPPKAKITNGAVCDMNPDTCAALGLPSEGVKVKISWEWA